MRSLRIAAMGAACFLTASLYGMLPDTFSQNTELYRLYATQKECEKTAKSLEKAKDKKSVKRKERMQKKAEDCRKRFDELISAKEEKIRAQIESYQKSLDAKPNGRNAEGYKRSIAELEKDLLRLEAFKQGKNYDPKNPEGAAAEPAADPKVPAAQAAKGKNNTSKKK